MSHDYRLYTTQLLLALASSRTPWPTFALLGYSFGGALAANFTAHFPHLVTGLILIAPGGLLRESHISWKSRFLYASPPLLPKVMVEKFVRERLWSGERSIEPEHASTGKEKDGDSKGKGKAVRFTNPPPSVASSVSSKGSKKKDKENTSSHKKNSTKKDSSETKAKKSDKKSDKKDKSKKGKEKAERKEHESESNDKESAEAIEGPSESSAHAEEREKGDGEGEKGEEKTRGVSSPNLYESGARPLLKKHPVSTISNVVHWQIRHYPAFIPAFISTIQNAPVHGQHHIWARIGARLKHQRSHPEDKEARTLGLDSGKVLLILGEHDKIVVVEEVKEDTEEVLGKENVKTWMMDAGHEVPIEKAEEVSKVVGWYLGARGH
jgi:pimeloyl-ACP methyl ester carboxylesterase